MINQASFPPEVWLAISAVIAAGLTAIGAYVAAHRANNRMTGIERDKLSVTKAEQYQRATERLIDDLRSEIDRLKERIVELTYILEKERGENTDLRMRLREVTETANSLRHTVSVLRQRLEGDDG